MSHSPDGANPYAAPDQPSRPGESVPPAPAPSGYEAVPPAPSGYEAPAPSGSTQPVYSSAPPPYGAPPASPYGPAPTSPYGPVPPYGTAPGYGSTTRPGRGLAIAGVVVGGLGTLVLVGMIVVGLLMFTAYQTDPEFRQEFDEGWSEGLSGTESSGDAYYELRTDLTVGTCIAAYPTEYDMSDAELVDCTTPHDTEVVGTVQLTAPVTTDPEDTEYAAAVDLCYEQIEAAAPGLLDVDGFGDVYTPHPDDFDEPGGDAAWCVFVSDGESLTGSIAGGDLNLGDEVTSS